MDSFFQGWRRKVGVLTLAMALLLFVTWMRSRVVEDLITSKPSGRIHAIVIANSRITWWAWDNETEGQHWLNWTSQPVHLSAHAFPPRQLVTVADLTLEAKSDITHSPHWGHWTASFLSMMIPLPLLSGYLILWKPQSCRRRHDSLPE